MDHRRLSGTVASVISGCSVVILFDNAEDTKGLAVNFSFLVAPKLKFGDESERFAFNSWNHLREKAIGQKVILTNFILNKENKRSPVGTFQLAFGQVLMGREDLGEYMAKSGYVEISNKVAHSEANVMRKRLEGFINDAKNKGLGMFGSEVKEIKPHIKSDIDGFCVNGEYTAIVESFIYPTKLSLYVLPEYNHIHMYIPGLKLDTSKLQKDEAAKLNEEAKTFLANNLAHRKIKVRFTTKSNSIDGVILDKAHNYFFDAIKYGILRTSSKKFDKSPYEGEYRMMKALAKVGRYGSYSSLPPLGPPPPLPGEYTTLEVIGNHTLKLLNKTDKSMRLVQLDCITMPSFVTGAYSQIFAFDTHIQLVEMLRHRNVTVKPTAATSNRFIGLVYIDNICLNVKLVREGLAIPAPPTSGTNLPVESEIKKANDEAKKNKRGIYSDNQSKPFSDYFGGHIPENRLGAKLHGFIDKVLSPSSFSVISPETREVFRLGILGIKSPPPHSRVGRTMKTYLEQNYLCADVEFRPTKSGNSYFADFITVGKPKTERTDKEAYYSNSNHVKENKEEKDKKQIVEKFAIADDLLLCGFANVDQLYEDKERCCELEKHEQVARSHRIGIWKDMSKMIIPGLFEEEAKVRVAGIKSPTRIFMQLICDEAQKLSSILRDAKRIPIEGELFIDDMVLAEKYGTLYRGHVIGFDKKSKDFVDVELIDFPMTIRRKQSQVFQPPAAALDVPRLGAVFATAFVKEVGEPREEDTERLWRLVRGKELRMTVRKRSLQFPPAVVHDGAGGLLNAAVLRLGGTALAPEPDGGEVLALLSSIESK